MARRDGRKRDTRLRCPECGYDLHGIPEVRCPECGFGFDKAALRNLAELAEMNREVVARRVAVAALVAIAAAFAAMSAVLDLPGAARLLAGAGVYLLTLGGLVSVTGLHHDSRYLPLLVLAAPTWAALMLAVFVLPVGPLTGVFAVTVGWFERLSHWPGLYPAENSPHAEERHFVDRLSACAVRLLTAATVCVVLPFLW